MPEGHTIHLFAADHRRAFAKTAVRVSSPQGRFSKDAKRIDGKKLRDVRAFGKNLFYDFSDDLIVHIHLGLHGKFTLARLKRSEPPPAPRGMVRMRMLNSRAVLDLNGPITCKIVDRAAEQAVIDRLGPDVLDPKSDWQRAWRKIEKRSTPIGLLLMDQSILSGIGNAYRCELLYRQKIHPLTPGKALSRASFETFWRDAVHALKMGVKHRMAWAVDETDQQKDPLREDGMPDRYNVYRRETCRGCGVKVKEIPLGGRRCFFCPKEQKLSRPKKIQPYKSARSRQNR